MSLLRDGIVDILDNYNENLEDDFMEDDKFGIPQDEFNNVVNEIFKLIEPAIKSEPLFNCANGLHMVDKTGICFNCGVDVTKETK